MSADNQQGRTQEAEYMINYSIIGVEESGFSSARFRANSDQAALDIAKEFVEEAQTRCNTKIKNPFWHFTFELKDIFRVRQEGVYQKIFLSNPQRTYAKRS